MGDSNLDSNLLASSESDSYEQKLTKSEDISTKKTSEKPEPEKVQLEQKPEEPKRCSTRIVLTLKEKKELSDEQKIFLAENVGKLNQRASEGVLEIVKDHISPDENGNLDFELEKLPYEVSLTLYNYVKNQIRLETNR